MPPLAVVSPCLTSKRSSSACPHVEELPIMGLCGSFVLEGVRGAAACLSAWISDADIASIRSSKICKQTFLREMHSSRSLLGGMFTGFPDAGSWIAVDTHTGGDVA